MTVLGIKKVVTLFLVNFVNHPMKNIRTKTTHIFKKSILFLLSDNFLNTRNIKNTAFSYTHRKKIGFI